MIYISTGGFNQKSVIEVIKLLSKNNINAFELSGGIYTDNLESKLKILRVNLNLQFIIISHRHKNLFVLNLASLNENIYQESLNHIKKSIKLASLINSPFYSFHAGFLIDPKVKELGKTIKSNNLYDRDKCLERFIYSIKLLSKYASRYQIKLLVENNVITKSNLTKFDSNPLLMTDIKSTREIINNFDDNLFFLVDVAHLKVSANTLNFDACEYLEVFKNKIGGYHLSDNNGLVDSNKEISDSSWFWLYLRNDLNYYTLEVYDHNPNVLLSQLELAKIRFIDEKMLKNIVCSEKYTLRKALKIIDKNAMGVCFVVNTSNKLRGILTDGDIRRALLNNADLDSNVIDHRIKSFYLFLLVPISKKLINIFKKKYKVIPLCNNKGEVVDFADRDHLRSIPILSPSLNGNELNYLNDCITTNWISSKGKYVSKFENIFEVLHPNYYALAVSNGTTRTSSGISSIGY